MPDLKPEIDWGDLDRWRGRVDERLDRQRFDLDDLHRWRVEHERWAGEQRDRFTLLINQVESKLRQEALVTDRDLRQRISDLKRQVAIHGAIGALLGAAIGMIAQAVVRAIVQ